MFLFNFFKKKMDVDLERRMKLVDKLSKLSEDRQKRSQIVNNLIEEKYLNSLNAHKIMSYVGLGRHCATIIFFNTEFEKDSFLNSPIKEQFEKDVIGWFAENKPETEYPFECTFDYDSDENVQNKWNGSYFNRLR